MAGVGKWDLRWLRKVIYSRSLESDDVLGKAYPTFFGLIIFKSYPWVNGGSNQVELKVAAQDNLLPVLRVG